MGIQISEEFISKKRQQFKLRGSVHIYISQVNYINNIINAHIYMAGKNTCFNHNFSIGENMIEHHRKCSLNGTFESMTDELYPGFTKDLFTILDSYNGIYDEQVTYNIL